MIDRRVEPVKKIDKNKGDDIQSTLYQNERRSKNSLFSGILKEEMDKSITHGLKTGGLEQEDNS